MAPSSTARDPSQRSEDTVALRVMFVHDKPFGSGNTALWSAVMYSDKPPPQPAIPYSKCHELGMTTSIDKRLTRKLATGQMLREPLPQPTQLLFMHEMSGSLADQD